MIAVQPTETNMQTGYLFKLAENFYGILTYKPETQVLARFTESNTLADVAVELSREFAGHFVPADTDQIAWGRTLMKANNILLLTVNGGVNV